jgi:hypothetical protein
MPKSRFNDISKSKKMGRPVSTGTGSPVLVRLQPDLLAAVDRHQTDLGAETRPETIRLILTDYLTRRGVYKKG